MQWPDKASRENLEIDGFIKACLKLEGARKFSIVSRREKPDFVLKEMATGEEFGVELTSVYNSDRSVPDVHMVDIPAGKLVEMPYDEQEIHAYEERLISAIADKVRKARAGYDTSRPLILSVYINEYVSIYMGKPELDAFVRRHHSLFDRMAPFAEIVFWNLGNGDVYQIRPS
jgi:hypothetical protein